MENVNMLGPKEQAKKIINQHLNSSVYLRTTVEDAKRSAIITIENISNALSDISKDVLAFEIYWKKVKKEVESFKE